MFAVGQKRRYMGGDSGATGKWSEFSVKEERCWTDAHSGNEENNSEEYSLKIRKVFPQVRSQGPENNLPRKGVARQALRFVFHSRWALQTLERPVPGGKWERKYVLLYGFCRLPLHSCITRKLQTAEDKQWQWQNELAHLLVPAYAKMTSIKQLCQSRKNAAKSYYVLWAQPLLLSRCFPEYKFNEETSCLWMPLDTDAEQVIPDKGYPRLRCDLYSVTAQYLPMDILLHHSQVR